MKIIIMILVVISLVFMSCSVSSPGSSDVTSVTIDQSNFTGLRIDAAIPTVTATVLYSDGSTDNDVTITYDGDTTSFNTFNMTATSNEDGSKSDSITVTVSDIVGSTWISGSKTITFDDDSNCTLDNNGTISASTYTLTGNNITTLFGYTINDDYTDESFTLNIDTYTLQ